MKKVLICALGLFLFLGFNGLQADGATLFVSLTSANPVSPFSDWSSASRDIQSAIDVANAGDLILVSNGVYNTGARRVALDSTSNRVAVITPVIVQSVNGPAVTFIQGFQSPGTTNAISSVRCAYLANNAVLSGFTLTNGATTDQAHAGQAGGNGGGVQGSDFTGVLSNCVITKCAASELGGGASMVILTNCVLIANNALDGGGAWNCVLNSCLVASNSVSGLGGGLEACNANNCLIFSNSAAAFGGGAWSLPMIDQLHVLKNCTVVGNSAGQADGGIDGYVAFNSIIYFNTAPADINYDAGTNTLSLMTNCCTTPLPTRFSVNTITNDPSFADTSSGDFTLRSNSPCINSGANIFAAGASDFGGNHRITGGTVDMGAFEFQNPTSVISYAWLEQFGLPLDGSADFADTDGDGMNNWQEWATGTNPTNAVSVLRVAVSGQTNGQSGVTLTWPSSSGITYFVQRSTNLQNNPAFSTLKTNVAGQGPMTTFTDSNAVSPGTFFYRVGVTVH